MIILVAALQIIVTVGLLGLIVERWGVAPFTEAARSLPWWALILAMALGGVGVVTQSLRWRIVARHHGIRVSVGSAIGRCWQAAFLNSVLPGGLAGDGLRAMDDSSDAETDDGRSAFASGFAAMAAERLLGTAIVFASAAAALAPLLPAVAAIGVVVAIVAVVVAWRWLRSLSARELTAVVLLSGLGWASFAGIFVTALVALAPSVDPGRSPGLAVGLSAVALAGMSVPIGIGGWGTREAAAGWGFMLVGLAPGLGVTVSIGYGLLALASTLPGAVVFAARLLPRLREAGRARARRRVRAQRELGAGRSTLSADRPGSHRRRRTSAPHQR